MSFHSIQFWGMSSASLYWLSGEGVWTQCNTFKYQPRHQGKSEIEVCKKKRTCHLWEIIHLPAFCNGRQGDWTTIQGFENLQESHCNLQFESCNSQTWWNLPWYKWGMDVLSPWQSFWAALKLTAALTRPYSTLPTSISMARYVLLSLIFGTRRNALKQLVIKIQKMSPHRKIVDSCPWHDSKMV